MTALFSTLFAESQKGRLQRWQSLSGALPLAGFLVLHLSVNALVLLGPNLATQAADDKTPWWQLLLELTLVYLPLAFHSLYGLIRTFVAPLPPRERVAAPGEYTRTESWSLRATGLFLLVFIVYHWSQFRYPVLVGAMKPSQLHAELCAELSSTIAGGVPLVALVHLFGIAAAAIHFAYGMRAFLRSYATAWGTRAQTLAKHGPSWVASVLFALGALTILELATGSWVP